MIAGLEVFGILAVSVIRIATDLAIQGWSTTIVGDLLIILLQTLVIVVAASLTVMAGGAAGRLFQSSTSGDLSRLASASASAGGLSLRQLRSRFRELGFADKLC